MPRRTILSLAALLLASCAPSEEEASLEISSEVPLLDRVSVTVFNPTGALILDERLPASGELHLPGRIRLDLSGHTEELRFLVWGLRGEARVAFGAVRSKVSPGAPLLVKLTAPPADRDEDLVPDGWDGCPDVRDPRQEDADADGITDACRAPAPTCIGNNIPVNPDFESSAQGWAGVYGDVSRITPGWNGTVAAARICRRPGATQQTYTLEEYPPALRDPIAGRKYRVDVSVRGDPQQFIPVIREAGAGDTYVGASNPEPVTLGSDWQRVSSQYQVKQDSAELLVEFTALDAPEGVCFEIDEVCFVEVSE